METEAKENNAIKPKQDLSSVLFSRLQNHGIMRFKDFMQAALYEPQLGFYETASSSIGKSGHFFTSVSVGPVFGQLLASWIALKSFTLPGGPLLIVEAGAHDARLACDLLQTLRADFPEVLTRIRYVILEPSPGQRKRQRKTADEAGCHLDWIGSWDELSHLAIRGFIISNELLDAFSVHRLGWDRANRSWFEWGVTQADGRLCWCRLPWQADGFLKTLPTVMQGASRDWAKAFGLEPEVGLMELLPEGYSIEVAAEPLEWWGRAAQSLAEGYLLAFDYGFEDGEVLIPHRSQGTLRGYDRHRVVDDLLLRPGEIDITAHVNFRLIREVGELAGLKTLVSQTQGSFLTSILTDLSRDGKDLGWTAGEIRQFKTLIHPEHLGRSHRVLVQQRGRVM